MPLDQPHSRSTGQSQGSWSRHDAGSMGKQQLLVSNKGVYHTDREGQVQINREENPRQRHHEENETHSVWENRRVRRNDWGAQLN